MTDTTKPYYFRRFVGGEEMAEEVQIIGAASLDEAIKAAVRICPKREMTVLVHSPLIPDYAAALAAGKVASTPANKDKRDPWSGWTFRQMGHSWAVTGPSGEDAFVTDAEHSPATHRILARIVAIAARTSTGDKA